MTDRAPTAIVASVTLHGLVLAGILLWGFVFRNEIADTKIIDLVAGAGDNFGATEAPALGTPDGTKPQDPTMDQPSEPKVLQAVNAPTATEAKPTPATPNFARQIERTSARVQQRQMAKFEKEQKAREEAEAKAEAARIAKEAKELAEKKNTMTKEEFDRQFGAKAAVVQKAADKAGVKIPRIDTKGIVGGVVGGSTANTVGGAGGTAMTREEGDMLDAYFSMLIRRLREAHQRPDGLSDLLSAKAEFYLDQDGTISRVRIVRSSGSPEFDQSVLSAFRNIDAMPPRRDSAGTLRREVTFKMRDD